MGAISSRSAYEIVQTAQPEETRQSWPFEVARRDSFRHPRQQKPFASAKASRGRSRESPTRLFSVTTDGR